ACRAWLSLVALRPGVRASKRRGLRSGRSPAAGEVTVEEGGAPGLQASAGNDGPLRSPSPRVGRPRRRGPPCPRRSPADPEPWGGGGGCRSCKNRVKPLLNTTQAQKAVPWELSR